MGEKSYLTDQIRLVSLTSYDFFTPEELSVYLKIIEDKKELKELDSLGNEEEAEKKRQEVILRKRDHKEELDKLIQEHKGKPRSVRLDAIVKQQKDAPLPQGVNWRNMKFSKKISEFCSELTRAMGLSDLDCTLDLVVISWKSQDILEQLVKDNFKIPILKKDGTVEDRFYHFFTASAGQLRRDKIMCISDQAWEKIRPRIECGLNWEIINKKKGCNQNKFLAYLALPCSATDPWTDFDIDRCLVIPDFQGEVTGRMLYIKSDYSFEDAVKTVVIDHTDGAGMMLPSVSKENFIARGPYFKGLLSPFDYLKFCKEHNVRPVIYDSWGLEHDLIKEDIRILFTDSQFKMWKYYDSWQDYKDKFKACGAQFGKMNYEEERIGLSTINYQFIQSLTDVTDEEVQQLTQEEHERISNMTKNQTAMLNVLGADKRSEVPYKAALGYYPEMLGEAYTKTQLKEIRKRMILDAKSGKLRMKNKRLFAVPDFYAACEHWFLHEEHPKGLLYNGEIACSEFIRYDKADVLRSPHLYMEHALRKINHNPEIYRWFTSKGVYTSCHDLISRILQFDVDGRS